MTDVYANVGKWLTVPEVAEIMQISTGKVSRLLQEHALLSVRRDSKELIPAELLVDAEPLHSLKGTILVLIDAGFTPESAATWLYSDNDSLGMTPIAALLAGRRAEIRRLAQALAL